MSGKQQQADTSTTAIDRFDGVVVGVLIGIEDQRGPRVAFPGNPRETGSIAKTTTALHPDDIGCEIALMFEGGDPTQPIVIGRIQHPIQKQPISLPDADVKLDGERLEFSAEKEIVLKCGKASITLTKAGKVIIKGAYVVTHSKGVNRIKGGSVQIN